MLKLLVRLAALGVAVFLAVLAGMFLSSEESGFPWNTDYTSRLDFSKSPLAKDVAIAELNELVDSSDLRLARVVADPENFLTSQSLYVFGADAPISPVAIDWFRPGMQGELRAAGGLGDTPLSGTYVYSGSAEAVQSLTGWANRAGVHTSTQKNTVTAVLSNALINTGAWLPFLTCLVLLVSLTVSWYVLRARARTVKVLNGASTARIVADDFLSLLAVSVPPMLAGFLLGVGFIALSGKTMFVANFALTTLALLGCALAVMLLSALLVNAFTWPTLAAIAARTPPERHFRLASEALKVATLVLVAISLPAAGTAIATATNLSDQGARWQSLSGQVSLRIGTTTPEEFDAQIEKLDALVVAADEADVLTFSYAMDVADEPELQPAGYDGLVMVNPAYLEAVAPFVGFDPSPQQPLGALGTAIPHTELAPALEQSLGASFELWNRAGQNLDGFDENFRTFGYSGDVTFPGLAPTSGDMVNYENPLIVVVDNPAETFDADFLSATLSSGNQMFGDASWLRGYLATSELNAYVLSIDRVSDNGLFASQQANQTAGVRIFSYALVVLALIASITVSAWIYALARGRRLFAQRTSGWAWQRVLSARLLWEAGLAVVITALSLVGFLATSDPGTLWILAAIPLYVALSAALHVAAVRKVFALRLARSE